jgi:hypothetical protein
MWSSAELNESAGSASNPDPVSGPNGSGAGRRTSPEGRSAPNGRMPPDGGSAGSGWRANGRI